MNRTNSKQIWPVPPRPNNLHRQRFRVLRSASFSRLILAASAVRQEQLNTSIIWAKHANGPLKQVKIHKQTSGNCMLSQNKQG